MLLVLGFVGTVVALERAVALRRPAGFGAPAGLGLGGLAADLTPLPLDAGPGPLVPRRARAGRGVYVPLWRRQPDDAVLVQAFGAVLAAGAALLWLAASHGPGAAAVAGRASWCSPSAASASSWPDGDGARRRRRRFSA